MVLTFDVYILKRYSFECHPIDLAYTHNYTFLGLCFSESRYQLRVTSLEEPKRVLRVRKVLMDEEAAHFGIMPSNEKNLLSIMWHDVSRRDGLVICQGIGDDPAGESLGMMRALSYISKVSQKSACATEGSRSAALAGFLHAVYGRVLALQGWQRTLS